MAVFALFVFVIMLMVTGIAVDTMRAEHERVRMQGATDRAVLAATMMREAPGSATPAETVHRYLRAEGLDGNVQERISVSETGYTRTVSAAPAARFGTTFMRLVGVDEVALATPAEATEALARIDFEIVLALDVSGSMDWDGRMGLLRTAATEFSRSMLDGAEPGQVSITLVPYSTEVILPPEIMARFTDLAPATNLQTYDYYLADGYVYPLYDAGGRLTWHTDDSCIDLADWSGVRARLTGAFDEPWQRRFCNGWSNTSHTTPAVRPLMSGIDAIKDQLEAIGPVWGTSIDLGVRAGALFFDPALRPAIQAMIDAGQIDPAMAGRPFDADRPQTVRALVLMTDGENCCHHPGDPGTRFDTAEAQDLATTEVCAGLRDAGVAVYSVAFLAPPRGARVMQDCASSPNHFFSSASDGLIDTFQSIGRHIQMQSLRLTQ